MRILYVAELRQGGNGFDRMTAINRIGHETVPFDVLPYYTQGGRLRQSVGMRFHIGPAVTQLNRDLRSFGRAVAFDAVWVDKGVWLTQETLSDIRKHSVRKIAIHYTPDSHFFLNRSRHLYSCIPIYDHLVTTKEIEINMYLERGARDVILILQGYGDRCRPDKGLSHHDDSSADVCFVGRREQHYCNAVHSASTTNCDVGVWGPDWPKYVRKRHWTERVVRGGGVWGNAYPRLLQRSKVCLGLLTKKFPETSTTRTFEIPASGGFLLAERTEAHQALFQEAREAEFFDGEEEMKDKLKFYCSNEASRQSIIQGGLRRSRTGGYDLQTQLARVMSRIET